MTTATIDRATTVGRGTLSRVLAVVRLQFTNPWSILIVPWLIMMAILAMNIIIWWLILNGVTPENRADVQEGFAYSGAGSYIFVYMLVVAVQAINGYFPFALGYGVTRRNYYLGISLTFVLLSALFALGISLLGVIEDATGGWWVGGSMFTAIYFGDDPLQRTFIYFAVLLFFFFVGSTIAAIYVRWKATGMLIFWVAFGFVLVGIVALLTLTATWHLLWQWFANAGLLGSYAASLVITLVAALAGYGILRRATPRS